MKAKLRQALPYIFLLGALLYSCVEEDWLPVIIRRVVSKEAEEYDLAIGYRAGRVEYQVSYPNDREYLERNPYAGYRMQVQIWEDTGMAWGSTRTLARAPTIPSLYLESPESGARRPKASTNNGKRIGERPYINIENLQQSTCNTFYRTNS